MASEKDPSIYSDRSTIGSADELDEYGVWVKSEPQDLSSVSAEALPEIEDLPDFNGDFNIESASGGEDSFEEEGFEFESIPEEEPETAAAGSDSFDESEFTEVSLNDFLTDAEDLEETVLDESEVPDPVPDLDFNQTESLEEAAKEEVMSDFDSAGAAGAEPKASFQSPPDLSTQLLMKIADELSSIKKELSSLKTEFSVIRRESAAESKEGGFFDEEDDEKIALTGDELDNILNTADFTEEAGSDATGAGAGDFGPMGAGEDMFPPEESAESSSLLDQPDIIAAGDPETGDLDDGEITFDESDMDELGSEYGGAQASSSILDSQEFDITLDSSSLGDDSALTGEVSGEEAEAGVQEETLPGFDEVSGEETGAGVQEEALPGFDEISGGEAGADDQEEIVIDLSDDFTDTLDLETKDSDELKDLREKGAEPLTEAPEDTSYLEEDPLGEAAGVDLSGAVIDEPDLSAGIKENPIEEPFLDDISLDLDMEENLTASDFSLAQDDGDISFEEDKELEVSIPGEESVLDIPPEEEGFDQIASDGFTVEAGEPRPASGDSALAEDAGEPQVSAAPAGDKPADSSIPVNLKQELKTVLTYMDQLLESLPEDKIEEFAKSEYFDTYKKLFEELGLV
ncbi:MAG: hypothetical protein LBQ14_06780 [Treponema sp.]|jgi:hypothetical protein|nr:hypothetical protein [Treponema sp.]